MKKVLIALFLLLAFSYIDAYSQKRAALFARLKELEKDTKIEQKSREDSVSLIFQQKTESNIFAKSGHYLSLSAKHQYAALGSAAVSAALFFGASKCRGEVDSTGEVKNPGRDMLNLFGACFAISSIYCEVMAITYKLKSGKCLMLTPTPDGITASLKF